MHKQSRGQAAAIVGVAAALLLPGRAGAQSSVEGFYHNREMRFVLSASAIGGYGTYARALEPFMEKYIPGKPRIVVQVMQGAGGVVAANWLANVAPKDGSVIAMIHRSAVSTMPLFGAPNIHFDPPKFGWLGSMNSDISVCVAWHAAPVKTFADLKTTPSIFGGIGPGSDMDMAPNMLNNLFDTKMQLITGYESGNAIHVAMERGEVHGRCGWAVGSLLATKPDWVRDKKVNVLVQIGIEKHPAFPDVPLLSELNSDPALDPVIETIVAPLQIIARPILTTPGVPPERLAALRKAFDQAMADPEFRATADKLHLEYDHVSGERVETVIKHIYGMPKPVIEKGLGRHRTHRQAEDHAEAGRRRQGARGQGRVKVATEITREDRIAAMGDLRRFIELSRERGELEIVKGADPYLEMGALYEPSLRKRYPPVLLFEDIKGYPSTHRIVMNVRFSKLFVDDLDMTALKSFRSRKKWEGEPIEPQYVNAGPICDNIVKGDQVDIRAFPAAHWHVGDGGPYIGTECLVINKDPDSDWVNIGTYRVQVQDEKTLTVFIEPGKHGSLIREKWWAKGKACPMVVCVGQAPILGTVASTASRVGVSEFGTAGGRLGEAIKVVRGELTDLPIPADAEVAFEGFMPPPSEEMRPEGPFAEWPGYYATEGDEQPVLRVGAIYYRDDPILIGQPPAKPTFPGRQNPLAGMAALWDALEAAGVPGVTGVWKPVGGGTRFINVISITQLHAGHAKMAGLVATGAGPGAYMGRLTIVVDDDIDVTSMEEVMWALATRWDPKTQTDIIDGCWTGYIDPLVSPDKRAAGDITTSRIIIYAVRPWHWKDQFPKVNSVPKSYSDEIEQKWTGKLKFLDSESV